MGKDVAAEKSREFQEEIRKFAEHLRQKVYARGYPEWGTLFSVIEELGVQIGDAVCREFVEQAVREQGEAAEDCCWEDRCPRCGGPLDHREEEPHPLLTRRGEIAWQEPQTYCPKCRKAFLPSVEELGRSG